MTKDTALISLNSYGRMDVDHTASERPLGEINRVIKGKGLLLIKSNN